MVDISNTVNPNISGRLRLRTGGPEDSERYVDQLVELFGSDFFDLSLRESHARFFTKERFRRMLLEEYIVDPRIKEKRVPDPTYKIVTLWDDDELVGFVHGGSLPPKTRFWKSVKESLPVEFTEESGHRTLGLFHILVTKSLRGHGLGRLLHTKFLEGRKEERVILLSEPATEPAYSIWQHWGYRKIGTTEAEGRTRDVFIRSLN